jgi:hypothetical protein
MEFKLCKISADSIQLAAPSLLMEARRASKSLGRYLRVDQWRFEAMRKLVATSTPVARSRSHVLGMEVFILEAKSAQVVVSLSTET